MNPVIATFNYNTSQQTSYKLELFLFKKKAIRLKIWILLILIL